jgi:hypothetical protein
MAIVKQDSCAKSIFGFRLEYRLYWRIRSRLVVFSIQVDDERTCSIWNVSHKYGNGVTFWDYIWWILRNGCYFRLPLRSRWELRSSGLLCSEDLNLHFKLIRGCFQVVYSFCPFLFTWMLRRTRDTCCLYSRTRPCERRPWLIVFMTWFHFVRLPFLGAFAKLRSYY